MRRIPLYAAVFLALAPLALGGSGQREPLRESYRADALRPLSPGIPLEVRAMLPPGIRWPEAARTDLEARIRQEWPPQNLYGPVQSSLGVWLSYPLVTARVGGRVLVPVLTDSSVAIQGRLELPPPPAPKRVVLLVDASSSANARTHFESGGVRETIPVLEAEHRALEHLFAKLDDDWLEFGIIAFGETTWPVVAPGASLTEVRARLAEFRAAHPRGEGRTDLVCALQTAVEWLDTTPSGIEREIVLLTDGDLPHSGRFTNCSRRRSREARERCERDLNSTPCPAERSMPKRGRSDLVQLVQLARRVRRNVRVTPVVFEPDRRAHAYRNLARDTGGQFVQVPSPQGIEVALPALVAGRVQAVRARNVTSGAETADLRGADGSAFAGDLPLVEGANDLELVVESDRGIAALFRFRVYAAGAYLPHYLEQLRARNRSLEGQARELVDEARALRPPERSLEVATE